VKSNAKAKIIILIALGILFALLPLITVNLSFITGNSNKSSEDNDDSNLDNKNPKISEVSGKIHIDNNWTAAKAAGICTGNGTYSNPYIIEDLVIDAGGSGSCIRIENSDLYFRIENCTLYNSEWSHSNAGIHLYNVDNGILIDNNCSSNFYGIYFSSSDNNTISGNIANNNRYFGIDLRYYSNNNKITENTVNNNNDDGIHLYGCNDNNVTGNAINDNYHGIYTYNCDSITVTGNSIIDNEGDGIYYSSSDNNIISGNNISNNEGDGIYYSSSDNNIISGNIINNNGGDGIHLYGYYSDCNNNIVLGNNISNSYYGIYFSGVNNTLSGNRMIECGLKIYGYLEEMSTHTIDASNLVNDKPLYYYIDEVNLGPNDFTNAGQIILVNCEHSLIFNLSVSYGATGISLYYSDNNNISENIANNNRDYGIYLRYSDNNYISGNKASNNYNGLYLDYSYSNNLSRNTANNNTEYGIFLYNNWGPTVSHISENDASHNYYGIYSYYSQGAIISGNNVSHNHYGIYLGSQENNVSGNNVSHNRYGIYLGSQENNVSGNNISFNNYGILLGGDNNIILGNIVDNNEIGIRLSYSQSNTIQQNVISNNDIGIDISMYCKCNIISNNNFSGNIVDIRGTQEECNPSPPGFVIGIVVFVVIIAIVAIGIKKYVSKDETARYYELKKLKMQVMEGSDEINRPRKLKFEATKDVGMEELVVLSSPEERISKVKDDIQEVKEEDQEVAESLRFITEEDITNVKKDHKEFISLAKSSKPTVEQTSFKEESIKQVVKEPISSEVLEEKEKPLPVKIEPSQPKILYCVFCGMEVDAERNFCQQCGYKLKKS
jgi:parallel beta-helix repeat protein